MTQRNSIQIVVAERKLSIGILRLLLILILGRAVLANGSISHFNAPFGVGMFHRWQSKVLLSFECTDSSRKSQIKTSSLELNQKQLDQMEFKLKALLPKLKGEPDVRILKVSGSFGSGNDSHTILIPVSKESYGPTIRAIYRVRHAMDWLET